MLIVYVRARARMCVCVCVCVCDVLIFLISVLKKRPVFFKNKTKNGVWVCLISDEII